MWHGWLLQGSGSNVATARTVEVFRAQGHDVVLLCQERHPDRFGWIDASGVVDGDGPAGLRPNEGVVPSSGRCVLLRPMIGSILPVFVLDPYEGWEVVRRFVDLSDEIDAEQLTGGGSRLRQCLDISVEMVDGRVTCREGALEN